MLYSLLLAYAIQSVFIIYLIRNYFEFSIDKSWIRSLTKYSKYVVIGGLSFSVFTNIDKILINHYMSIAEIGVYRAYNYSFTSVTMIFSGMISSVLFPFASMYKDKRILFSKINHIIPYFLIIGIPFSLMLGIIVLKLYGNEYNFDIKLASVCGIGGVIMLINDLYTQLMNSTGVNGIKIVSITGIIMTFITIILNICLIPLFGILGSVLAVTAAYILSICIVYSKLKRSFQF
jgi:O-antigen/teichoic acid export membrane protein